MKSLVFLTIFLVCFGATNYAQETLKRNTIITGNITGFYTSTNFFMMNKTPRVCADVRVFPLNWLSVGAFYSPDYRNFDISNAWLQGYGATIGLHSYPLFKLLKTNYLNDHFDFFIEGFFQRDMIKLQQYWDFDPIKNEMFTIDVPRITHDKKTATGYVVGLSYYFMKHIGITGEIGRKGSNDPTSQYKLGLSFRL
jgi:hypothetical protein